ncbi:TonB-dependent receptor plug domain-containing protein [Chromobacterium haemolyticum]|uniref:TonB-dependent receptor plug domain-containing protein n=1 Tax=Chromobacterium haemolyticum TaxID=394935 RepID=UPI000DEF4DC2|nr:TonB-dependent receptor [Chromobacterium haemolyticum]
MNCRKKKIVLALAMLGVGAASLAHADENNGTLDRVEVTGSNIKRSIKQEQAAPVTIIRTEDLSKQGLNTVEQVVNSLAANQSTQGASASVGASDGGASYANLRGLGSQYTLVLLDGRRMANQPMDGYAVDLNAIPLSAVERVEVLRDGASAIYGTDAIGGVINFITKKSITGFSIGGDLLDPQHGGGHEKSVNGSFGIGDLNKDGYNIYVAANYHKANPVFAVDRPFAIPKKPRLSTYAYPVNIQKPDGTMVNIGYPACSPPYSVASGGMCKENYALFAGIQPEIEQASGIAKGTMRIGDNHELSLQYLISRNKNTSSIQPGPTQLTLGDVTYPNGDVLYGRSIPLGNRVNEGDGTAQRLMLNMEGLVAGWDYKAGLGWSEDYAKNIVVGGYLSNSKLQSGITSGSFDPTDTSAAGRAAWKNVSVTGTADTAKSTVYSADFKVSKEVLQLPAGMMAVALGVEARKEKLSHDYNYDVSKDAVGLGMDAAKSAAGQRNINALFAEADIPVVKNLDAQLALRYDRYSDFGSSVNPKVALRYQPLPQLMFRSSASTGFRAPSLYDVNQPNQVVNTAQGFYDPTYCPNGVAQPGAGPKACDGTLQRNLMTGGNKSLSPEKSSSLSFGIVIEPVKNLTASADFWWTMIHDTIGTVDEAVLLDPANAAKYASLMNRDAKNDLNYISSQTMNLGTTSASGIDLKVSWTSPRTSVGTFNIGLDGTYMTKYQYQVEKGGAYHNSLGVFIDTAPTFRWQHNLSLGWAQGVWSALLAQDYKSGYTDQDPSHNVRPYSTWNLSGSYVWDKKLTFTVGARNLFDQEPPVSNQQKTFQQGYDPRFTDPVGRAYFAKFNYKM